MKRAYCNDYKVALKMAIDRENEAEVFYEKAAEKVHQYDSKSLLKRLAIDEKDHQRVLKEFSHAVTAPPKGNFLPPVNLLNGIVEEKMQTTEQIFNLAIQKEEESLNFYSRLLVYFLGTGDEDVFKRIFDVEAKHKAELERNMENYLK